MASVREPVNPETRAAVRTAASTPTTNQRTSAANSSHPPAPAANGLARSVVSANNSGRVIRSASVTTAMSVSNRTTPITPAPAVAARPSKGRLTASTTASTPGSTATNAATVAAVVGDPSAVTTTPINGLSPANTPATSSNPANTSAYRRSAGFELTVVIAMSPLSADAPHSTQPEPDDCARNRP